MTGSFIVAYCLDEPNADVLIVGSQDPQNNLNIVNAFSGENAKHVYNILTEKKPAPSEADETSCILSPVQ